MNLEKIAALFDGWEETEGIIRTINAEEHPLTVNTDSKWHNESGCDLCGDKTYYEYTATPYQRESLNEEDDLLITFRVPFPMTGKPEGAPFSFHYIHEETGIVYDEPALTFKRKRTQTLVRLAPYCVPVHTVNAAEEAHVLRHGKVVIEREALTHVAYVPLHLLRLLAYVIPCHDGTPGRRAAKAAEHAHGCGLSGSVSAEKAEYLATAHAKADIINGSERAEFLCQPVGRYHAFSIHISCIYKYVSSLQPLNGLPLHQRHEAIFHGRPYPFHLNACVSAPLQVFPQCVRGGGFIQRNVHAVAERE